MFYAFIGLIVLASIGLALYASINMGELEAQVSALQAEVLEQEAGYSAEIEGLKNELERLEKYMHIANIFEKSDRLESDIAVRLGQAHKKADEILLAAIEKARELKAASTAKLEQAQTEADEIVLIAHREAETLKARAGARDVEAQQKAAEMIRGATLTAEGLKRKIVAETEIDNARAKAALGIAERQAAAVLEAAEKEAKAIASLARKEAKEKTQKVEQTLLGATAYSLEIRERAESRAKEIGAKAYDAMKRREFYEATATAMQNVVSGYAGTYMVPASHMLDELAEEYGFHKAGERLKFARDRTRLMEKYGEAASCNYPEGWKRDYAIKFILGAFDGKVDSILAKIKPANQGKLIQEIKDVYALANHNGEVFRNTNVKEEYLESRLEELKWGVAVQRVREKQREEQRAIRDQIREEEKARKDYERAIKQAEREEDILAKAMEKAQQEYDAASAEERVKYEANLVDLAEKLRQAEEKNQRAISMAQQTKSGHVYVISNIGSFGDDVYKIGLTRRLEPLDRVKELGGASVPFGFDVHAMIFSKDAPALEAALHRRFLQNQVNKANRRKEFFRLRLQDIRDAIDEMKYEATWTMVGEARDYHETRAMESQMQEDPEFRKRWAESEAAYEARLPLDDEGEEAMQEEEELALAEGAS